MKTQEIRFNPKDRNQVKGIIAHYYTRIPQVLLEVLGTSVCLIAAEHNEYLLKRESQIIETLIDRNLI